MNTKTIIVLILLLISFSASGDVNNYCIKPDNEDKILLLSHELNKARVKNSSSDTKVCVDTNDSAKLNNAYEIVNKYFMSVSAVVVMDDRLSAIDKKLINDRMPHQYKRIDNDKWLFIIYVSNDREVELYNELIKEVRVNK